MSPEQSELRFERMAIMTICGKVSEAEAQKHCDSVPELYGIEGRKEQQEGLGLKDVYQYR